MGTAPKNEVPKFGADKGPQAGPDTLAKLKELKQNASTKQTVEEGGKGGLTQLSEEEQRVTEASTQRRKVLAGEILEQVRGNQVQDKNDA